MFCVARSREILTAGRALGLGGPGRRDDVLHSACVRFKRIIAACQPATSPSREIVHCKRQKHFRQIIALRVVILFFCIKNDNNDKILSWTHVNDATHNGVYFSLFPLSTPIVIQLSSAQDSCKTFLRQTVRAGLALKSGNPTVEHPAFFAQQNMIYI